MSAEDFNHLKNLIEPKAKKMDTQFREAITVTERLAIYNLKISSHRGLIYEFAVPI